MSLARLWRDHGKVQQARELLALGLVHRRLRHARSERGGGAAGGVGGIRLTLIMAVLQTIAQMER